MDAIILEVLERRHMQILDIFGKLLGVLLVQEALNIN
jgi:hypothetical protein